MVAQALIAVGISMSADCNWKIWFWLFRSVIGFAGLFFLSVFFALSPL